MPCNDLQHAFRIHKDLAVPEPHHAESVTREESHSRDIRLGLRGVLPAIQLDDQACFGAAEVGDVRLDQMLTPELGSLQSPISEATPELTLGVGLAPSERAGEAATVPIGIGQPTLSPCPLSPLGGEGSGVRAPVPRVSTPLSPVGRGG